MVIDLIIFEFTVDEKPITLISKHWIKVSIMIIFFYSILCIIVYYVYHSDNPNHSYSLLDVAISGAKVSGCTLQLLNVVMNYINSTVPNMNVLSVHLLHLLVMTVQCVSDLLYVTGTLDDAVQDSLGVKIPIVYLIDRICTVPTMFYLNITLISPKHSLTWEDYSILISSLLCLIINFVSTLAHFSYQNSLISLIISSLSMQYALHTNYVRAKECLHFAEKNDPKEPDSYVDHSVASRRVACTVFLLYFSPLFTVVYCLCMFDFITNDTLKFMYSILDFLSKVS